MNWEEIRKEYETSNITMKDLAEKHGAKLGTLKSRASREKWKSNPVKKVATKNATKRKKVATEKAAKIIDDNPELKGWEIEFCYEYVRTWNATRSYMKVKETTYGTAAVESHKLLKKPNVISAIKDIKKETDTGLLISVEDIKREYFKQAFSDINDVVKVQLTEHELNDKRGNKIVDTEGNPVIGHFNEVYVNSSDEFDGTLIRKISQGKDGISVELYDKQKALQELLKLMSDGDGGDSGVVFVDNEQAMKEYMEKNGEAYAD